MNKRFIKNIGLSLGVLLTAGTIDGMPMQEPVHVEAATVYATTEALNLRAGASITNKVLVKIPKGRAVKVISHGKTWSKVTYGSKTGYVNARYLKKAAASAKEEKFKAKQFTTTAATPLYSKTTSGKKALVTIPKGKVVTSTTKLSGYYKVVYAGKTGWVTASRVKDYKPASPAQAKFLSKADSLKLLTTPTFVNDSRKVFEAKNEYGLQFVNAYLIGATEAAKQDYLFVIGEYDSNKLSAMTFVMNRYHKYPFAQKNGVQALELGLSGFFGRGTKETDQLVKLVKENMTFTDEKLVNLTIGGRKGYIVVNRSTIDVIFDYDGELPTIRQ
ncbi:SH3 domain-containing protein [Exiguobacterium flavidum]|uniref:SH3 domain-containing protein n=1 Tax=Exiguobacterium flavidum TaxID=2184695 RepID=UPI001300B053|nr:SH3 domain-containing protein [Exiguobacterium flavidum]